MYRPYVSLDIETTGVGPEVDILQISAVLDEFDKEIEDLETFDIILKHTRFKQSEPYAIYLNAGLIDIIRQRKDPRLVYPRQAIERLIDKLESWKKKTIAYDEAHFLGMKGKHVIAGKNVSSFDKPKLIYSAETYGNKTMAQELSSKWMCRSIDVGPMYFHAFGYVPSMDEINTYLNRAAVTHNALDDAFDVVHAVREHYNYMKILEFNIGE